MLVPQQGTREQLHALWKTACSRAVWQPMGFISLYLAMFVSNAACRQFLKSVLGFGPNQLNALLFVAGALAFAGVVVYKFVLIQ
jgi:predicted MFS family arabinose efflux permease